MLYIKIIEPIYFIIFIYVILQIVIIVVNEINEKVFYEKILKEFVETTNKVDYRLNYIGKASKEYKNITKEEYRKVEDYFKKEIDLDENRYNCNAKDYIEGELNSNIHIKITKVDAWYSEGKRVNRKLFNGSFITIDKNINFDLEIRCKTVTKKDNANNLVLIDNNNFNKYYKVYADNKENFSKFISTELLTFIADFREKFEIDFEIFFKDKIYIKFYTMNLFNREGMTEKNIDILSPGQYFLMLKFITELLEQLNT